LLVFLNLTFPTSGSSAGAVITTLPRGYWNTQPPSESCSTVTQRMRSALAASDAEKPAGPAPTMTRSSSPASAGPAGRAAITSTAWRPCSSALRIRPMPPSSPEMKIPGTLVSNSGVRVGRSTPRRSEPNTSEIAPTGQAVRQAP
jgi:hypothetical protein